MENIESSYLSHFGMLMPPFDEARDTSFFFESDDHLEALVRLEYIVNDGNMNFGLLTGEVGSGKTLLRMVLQKKLEKDHFEAAVMENSFFPFEDIVYEILSNIENAAGQPFFLNPSELPLRGDKYGLVSALKRVMEIIHFQENRHLVLILDESQHLDLKDLDELKNLTNISADGENLITIILVGQPELREKVRSLKQVDQRVSLRFHLNNLHFEDAKKYVQHRLKIAGHKDGNVIVDDALEILFRYTLGVPREINRACKLSLEHAYANDYDQVGRDVLKTVLDDLERHRL